MEKRADSGMAREKKNTFPNQSGPIFFEVTKWNGLVNLGGFGITANRKGEAPLSCVLDVAFVKGSIMIYGEFGIMAEEDRNASQVLVI